MLEAHFAEESVSHRHLNRLSIIGTNISLDSRINEMIGFTEDEVRTILAHYQQHSLLPLGTERSLTLVRLWYNNYRFGQRATTPMYNADMVLYFLIRTEADDGVPLELIDQNIRIDYGKLRHLMAVDKPFLARFPAMQYGYLIELEYISHTRFNQKDFDQSLAQEKAEAER